jgi:hypothetical protein
MSRNSEHLSSVYNSILRLKRELSEYRLWVSNVINAEIAVLTCVMLRKNAKRIKIYVEGRSEDGRENILSIDEMNLM